MALTKEDLQAIASLISQSENRIMSYIESHVEKDIQQIAEMCIRDRIYTVGNVLRYWSTGIGSPHESNMAVAGIALE